MFDPVSRREAIRRASLILGGVLTAPTLAAMLGGCRAEAGADYAYRALTTSQQGLTARLVDLIIPATDTPGAKAAGVPGFIDKMLADWMPDEDRARFLAGLADVDARAQKAHQKTFADLDDAQAVALLTTMDREAYAAEAEANGNAWGGRPAPSDTTASANAQSGRTGPTGAARVDTATAEGAQDAAAASRAQSGTSAMEDEAEDEVGRTGGPGSNDAGGDQLALRKPSEAPAEVAEPAPPAFFRTLKEITLAGYYTSEIGATQELRWVLAPGDFKADLPLADVNGGRTWA